LSKTEIFVCMSCRFVTTSMTLFANGFDMDEIGTPNPISYPPLVFVKSKHGC
jgi:hypothetical protein